MHPTLARYLDPEAARAVLLLSESGDAVPDEHRHLVAAANANPREKRLVVKATGKNLDSNAQQAVLFLATFAALRAIEEDASLKAEVTKARTALMELGAEAGEVDAMLAQAVADEAFGTDEDPGHFDADWFKESLRDLPKLAALEEDEVHALLSAFAGKAPKGEAMIYENAARALLETAWGDGAAPITIENVEDTLDALADDLGEEDFEKGAAAIAKFLEALAERGLVGPRRAEKLTQTAKNAAAAGIGSDDEDDDFTEDESDEEPEDDANA